VQLIEIENSLPNGFHDAILESVEVDYVFRRVEIKLRLWTGDPDASNESEKEAYREAHLELLGLVYFVIEGPDPKSKYPETKGLWIDGGEVKSNSVPTMPSPIEQVPPGTFKYWFFVRDWNSFIHFAAQDARLQWS